MYAEDWDGSGMAPATRLPSGYWQTWPGLLRPYVGPYTVFSNPANPVMPEPSGLRDPRAGYAINSSYALNRRFWNTFSPGPFPIDNLELPAQTALFLEAGPMWKGPTTRLGSGANAPSIAVIEYGDITDRYQGLTPYPSSHDGRMAVAAADGHALLLRVDHYSGKDGIHDTQYGRIGENCYNWNGGHPNGETDRPAHE